jgi:hypothetical protein
MWPAKNLWTMVGVTAEAGKAQAKIKNNAARELFLNKPQRR